MFKNVLSAVARSCSLVACAGERSKRMGMVAGAAALAMSVAAQGQVRISQIYAGGGDTGAAHNFDYVELYNAGASAVDLSNVAVHYASATGTSYARTALAGSIPANGYYLVRMGTTSSTVGLPLPTPDLASTTSNISGTAGKIALVMNSTGTITGQLPLATGTLLLDFVGYGLTADAREAGGVAGFPAGTTASNAPVPSATLALFRAGCGSTDTNVNSADFVSGTPAPRNSRCPLNLGLTGRGLAQNAAQGATITLQVNAASIAACTGAAPVIDTVTADASMLGGSSSLPMTLNAGNYEATVTVANSAFGPMTVPFVVTETPASRTGGGAIAVNVTITGAPANDVCTATYSNSAFEFPSGGGVFFGSNVAATNDAPTVANCTNSSGLTSITSTSNLTVWYTITPNVTGRWTISTCANGAFGVGTSAFDNLLAVYSGTSCGDAVQLGCSDDSCGTRAHVAVDFTAGSKYLIRVSGFGSGTGSFLLAATGPGVVTPSNDLCGSAVPLTLSVPVSGTTLGSTGTDVSSCGDGSDANDVWYSFTPHPASGTNTYVFSACPTNGAFDCTVSVFSGSCGSLTQIVCDTDTTTGCSYPGSRASAASLVGGTTYFVRVAAEPGTPQAGVLSGGGPFSMMVSIPPAPSNETCATATTITVSGGSGSASGNNFYANSALDPAVAFAPCVTASKDVFYTFTPTAGPWRISTCTSTTQDTVLELFMTCADGSVIACNDDFGGCGDGTQSRIDATLTAVAHRIRVSSKGGAATGGPFTLSLLSTSPPANDAFGTATGLAAGTSTSGTNEFATLDGTATLTGCAGAGTLAKDVWFTATSAAGGGKYVFSTLGSSFDTVLAIYDATGTTELACNDDACSGLTSEIVFTTAPSTTYLVRLASKVSDGSGSYSFVYNAVATNDDCATPTAIGAALTLGATVTTPTNMLFSSLDGGASACSVPVVKDVWYSLNAGRTGTWTFNTCASGFDTVVEVLSGCGGSVLACNDDFAACGGGTRSTVTASLTTGTTYLIRVAAKACTATGGVSITALAPPPANDTCQGATLISGDLVNGGAGQSQSSNLTGATPEINLMNTGCPAGVLFGTPTQGMGAAPGASGVWFSVVGNGNRLHVDNCGTTPTFDSVIMVFCGACDGFTCVTSNDDSSGTGTFGPGADGACAGSGTLSSCAFDSVSGRLYYIWTGSFTTGALTNAIVVTVKDIGAPSGTPVACGGCTLTVPSLPIEGEGPTCLNPNNTELFDGMTLFGNGGCDGTTPGGFEPLGSITSPIGRIGFSRATPGGAAALIDADWYAFTVPTMSGYRLSGGAGFPSSVSIRNLNGTGPANCTTHGTEITLTTPTTCGTFTGDVILSPGNNYAVRVRNTAIQGFDCEGAPSTGSSAGYYFQLGAAPQGACCTGSGCVLQTQIECSLAMGTYLGDGTTCPTPPASAMASSAAYCSDSIPGTFSITATGGGGTGTTLEVFTGSCGGTPVPGMIGPANVISFAAPTSTTQYFVRYAGPGGCGNSSCVTVDVTVTTPPTADAQGPLAVCAGNGIGLNTSTASNHNGVLWTAVPGGGTFTPDAMTAAASYQPSAADILFGSVQLTLTASPNAPCATAAVDQITVGITPAPSAVAPADTIACELVALSLTGIPTNGTGAWSIITPGAGSLDNPLSNPVMFTPASGFSGPATLRYTVTGAAPCAPVFDDVIVTVTPAVDVDAGSDFNSCSNTNVSLNGTAGNNAGTLWSSPTGGAFADATNPVTTYTPTATDLTNGSVLLTLTGTGNAPCANASDSVLVTFIPALSGVSAGPDVDICTTQPSVILTGTATNAASVLWSGGTGTFVPANALITTYTPGLGETGLINITFTAFGNAPCANVSDTMVLRNEPAPSGVSAGLDQVTCELVALNLVGTASNHNGVQWSGGTGSFSGGGTTLSTTYTPGVGETGTVTLTLTALGNAPCANVTDTVDVQINPRPATPVAGSGTTVCAGVPHGLTATVGPGEEVLWFTGPGPCGTTQVGSGSPFVVAPTMTTTYHARARNIATQCVSFLCSDETVNITTSLPDVVGASGSAASVCSGSPLTLSGTIAAGEVIDWYTGSCSGTLVGTGVGSPLNSLVVYPTSPTTYFARRRDATFGCTSDAGTCPTVSVGILSTPAVPTLLATVPSNGQICAGASATLSVVAPPSGVEIDWYAGGCAGAGVHLGLGTTAMGVNSIVVAPTITTTYHVRARFTSGTSCASVCATVTITVNPLPNPPTSPVASVNPVCEGAPTILSATAGPGETLQWFTGSCNGTMIGTGTPTVNPTGTTTYWVNAINNLTGCSDGCSSVTVNVTPAPGAPSVGSGGTICNGDSFLLNGVAPPGFTLEWYTGVCPGTLVGTGTGFSVSPTSTTTYHGHLRDNTTLCLSTSCAATVTVTVNTNPTANAGTDFGVCLSPGSPVALSGLVANTPNYTWSTGAGDGTFANPSGPAATTYTPGPNDIANGSVVLTLTAFALAPCTTDATDTVTLTILTPPFATTWVDDSFVGPNGTVVTWTGAAPAPSGALVLGCNAFTSIQGGVNAVTNSGTVRVAAGGYGEVTVTGRNSVSILGDDKTTTVVVGSHNSGSSRTFEVQSSPNTTVAGFTITRSGNNPADWATNVKSYGVVISSANGSVFRDCIVSGNRNGLYMENNDSVTVRNNTIDNNRTGMHLVALNTNCTVAENFITNNWTVGVLFRTESASNDTTGSEFFNNNITGNWYGQIEYREDFAPLGKNFSGNWLGSTSPSVIATSGGEPGYAGQIPVLFGGAAVPPPPGPTVADIKGNASAQFDVTPMLNSGTDTNASAYADMMGFQGEFSSLTATTLLAQTGPTGRVEEGVDLLVDGALTGGNRVLSVQAGTYLEKPSINQSATVAGPNAGIDPCTGVRGAEAIIQPDVGFATLAGTTSFVIINANNVTFDGLTVDGDNPAIVSPFTANGANPDVDYAISAEAPNPSDGLNLKNTIVKNSFQFGVVLGSTGSASKAGRIEHNKFDNIPYWAAVLAYDDYYAAIENNCMNNVWLGVQTNNFFQAKPPLSSATISNNTITTQTQVIAGDPGSPWTNVGGILHNLQYTGASAWTISSNVITNTTTASTGSEGITVWSLQTAVAATISNNTISGFADGYSLWNNPTSSTVTVSGGSVTGAVNGVKASNFQATYLDAASSTYVVTGITITGASANGVLVEDSASNTNSSTVHVQVTGNSAISGAGSNGVQVSGADASATVINNLLSITGNAIGVLVDTGEALIQTTNLTGNTVAGIQAQNGATVDAGQCGVGSNVTGLGISTGGNNLTGYLPFVSAYAIRNLNTGSPDVLAHNNNFTAVPANITTVLQESTGQIQFSNSTLFISCPANVAVQCPANVPVGATTLAAFELQGGTVSASAPPAVVGFSDSSSTVGPVTTIMRTYTVSDGCNSLMCSQTITVQDTTPPTVTAGPLSPLCYGTVAAAELAAIAATTAHDNPICGGSVVLSASTVFGPLCSATVTVTGTDPSGNTAQAVYSGLTIDAGASFTGPSDVGACTLGTASFSVTGTFCPGTTFQWYKGVTPIFNGPTGNGSTYSGAGAGPGPTGTPTLTITGVAAADAGSFHVDVTGPCSSVVSSATATLTVGTASPSITYVDDGYIGLPNGTLVDHPYTGAGTHIIGCDAFAVLQDGINAVANLGQVLVASGTYAEATVTGRAGLSILGIQGAATTIVVGSHTGGSSRSFEVQSSPGTTVAGFTITRSGNNCADWATNVKSYGAVISSSSGSVFRDNIVTGNRNGLYMEANDSVFVRNNIITDNRTGMHLVAVNTNCTVAENEITNNWTMGVLFRTESVSNDTTGTTFFNNNITANWYAQIEYREDFVPMGKNFSGNWLGTITPSVSAVSGGEPGYAAQIPAHFCAGGATPPGGQPDVKGTASAQFDITPLLTSGTDTNNSNFADTNAFQGDLSSLYVHNQLAQTGAPATQRIQEGITILSDGLLTGGGRLVILEASTFKENPIANKALTLKGANFGIAGDAVRNLPESTILTNGNQMALVLVSASDVTIDGVTLDGDDPLTNNPFFPAGLTHAGTDANTVFGVSNFIDNPSPTPDVTLPINNLAVRNNIIKHTFQGVRTQGDGVNASAGIVTRNWFDDIGVFDYGYALSARFHFYTDFTANKVTRAWTGVHTSVHSLPGPTTWNLSNNNMEVYGCGIANWGVDTGAATGATITGNQITLVPGAPFVHPNNTGILVSYYTGPKVSISANTITGMAYGIVTHYSFSSGVNTAAIGANTITNPTIAGIRFTDNLLFDNTPPTDALTLAHQNPVGTTNLTAQPLPPVTPPAVPAMFLDITGATINGALGYGIVVQSVGPSSAYAEITANTHADGTGAAGTAGVLVEGALASASILNNLTTFTAFDYGIDVNGGAALIENNTLTGNDIAGIRARNGALVDAGDCSGSNITGLGTGTGSAGSSAGLNNLSGYVFDNLAPYAIENVNLDPVDVRAQGNNFGAGPGDNIGNVIFDTADNAGNSQVFFSQSGGQGIQTQPSATSACVGGMASFTVVANGTVTYQWFKSPATLLVNGGNISGADTATLTINPVGLGDAGTYYVTVTDACTNVATSSPAVALTVVPPPTVNANGPYTMCANGVLPLNGLATNASSVMWSIVDGPADPVGGPATTWGFFHNDAILGAVYTPGPLAISQGFVTLKLTANATSPCVGMVMSTALVTINPLPVAPTMASANANNFCQGSIPPPPFMLTATGGSGAKLAWSAGSCSGPLIGSGPTITIAPPTTTTTYYAKWINSCGQSACASVTVTVIPLPNTPTLPSPDATICFGSSTTISASVGVGETIDWFTTSCGVGPAGTGTSLLVSPASTTTYFGRARTIATGCVSAACVSITVNVTPIPTDPSSASVNTPTYCSNAVPVDITLTASGGTGGNFKWYSGTCGGTLVGTGPSITIAAPTSDTTYFVRREDGACFSPNCLSVLVDVVPAPTANAGSPQTICSNGSATLGGIASNNAGTTWSAAPDGSFDNTGSLTAIYTPGPLAIANGSALLTLTATGNGPCLNATSNVTITITTAPSVSAGSPSTVCSNIGAVLNGSASNAASVLWTGGTGTFANPASAATTYTPGLGDSGPVVLTLTATGNPPCGNASSQVTITVVPKPTANADGPYTTCSNTSVTLNGSATNFVTHIWSTLGDGTFNNTSLLNATYTPGAADIIAGSVILKLTSTGNAPCDPSVSQTMVTITNAPMVSAGPAQSVCSNSTVSLSGSAVNSGTTTWTTSGDGSFSNANILNPIYTPGANDLTLGSVTLTLTGAGLGPCANGSSNVLITFVPAPTVNAGTGSTVCSNVNAVLNGSSTNSASVLWTGGTGTFANSASAATTYTPGAGDNGPIVLTLTATGNAPCASASSQVIINVVPAPVVNAGSPSTVCSNTNATLNGTASNAASVLWTGGTGTFFNANAAATTYTPGPGDNGPVILTLTATGNAPCLNSSSQVTITVVPAPAVSAGADLSVCSNSSVLLGGTASNTASVLWTGGTGTFAPNANTAAATYTPGVGESGPVVLTLTGTANAPCANVSDTVTVTVFTAPTASAGGPYTICEGGVVSLIGSATNFSSHTWTTAGDGTIVNPAALSTSYQPGPNDVLAGTVTLTLTAVGNGPCANAVSNAILTINPLPVAPTSATSTPPAYCANNVPPSVTLNAIGGSGTKVIWTVGSCNGTIVGSGPALVVAPAPTTTITYFAKWVNGCGESVCVPVTITVDTVPVPLASAAVDVPVYCSGQPPVGGINLSASGGSGGVITWYSGSCGGTPVGTGSPLNVPAPLASTSYFARRESGTCTSGPCVQVDVTVNVTPTAPTAPAVSTPIVCSTTPPADITLTATPGSAGNIVWYAGGCGAGAPIGTGSPLVVTPAPLVTTTYFARQETANCNSLTCASVTVTVTTTPTAPTSAASSSTVYCFGSGPANVTLTASGGTGGNFAWYSGSCGGTPVGVGSPLVIPAPSATTTYFVRREDGPCPSATCASVTVTVNTLPATPGAPGSPYTMCQGTILMITATPGIGETIDWYSTSCGGIPEAFGIGTATLNVSPSVTTTYFARARNTTTGCVSAACASVIVNVNPRPATPNAGPDVTICAGSSTLLSGTTVGGTTIDWTTGSCSGGTPVAGGTGSLTVTVSPATTTTYFARARNTVTSCTSAVCDTVVVTVTPIPVGPTSASSDNPSYCSGAIPATVKLTAVGGSGGSIKWYSGSCGGTAVGTGNPLTIPAPGVTTTYFARMENGACFSPTCASTTVTVNASPVAPTGASVDTAVYCSAAAPANITLTATGGSGITLRWYTGSCGGTFVGSGTPLVLAAPATSTTYFARWETLACGVSACASVGVTVNPTPVAPTSVTSSDNNFCLGSLVNITLTAAGGSGATVQWFDDSCGGNLIGTGNPLVISAPVANTTYFARYTSALCGNSTCASLLVTVNPAPTAPSAASVDVSSYCSAAAPANILLTATGGSNIVWYSGSCGGTPVGTGSPLSIPAPSSTTTYFARGEVGTCLTACVDTTVTVTPNAPAPTSAGVDAPIYCSDSVPATITLTATGGSGIKWYTGSCGGTLVGSTNPLVIPAPASTTTYFARSEPGVCVSTSCASVTVTVSPVPVAPTSASVNTPTICTGGVATIELSAVGGSGATLRWYSGSCGGTLVGSGTPLTIPAPGSSVTYFARWESPSCTSSTCVSVGVTVNQSAVAPTNVTTSATNYCAGSVASITLTATGGSGLSIEWFDNTCGGNLIGTTNPLIIGAPTSTTTYYARYTSVNCGPSTCAQVTVTVNSVTGACCTGFGLNKACMVVPPSSCVGTTSPALAYRGDCTTCVPLATCCPADYDNSGTVSVGDIFSFLKNGWFVNHPTADFDGDSDIDVTDIFQFLSRWFSGC